METWPFFGCVSTLLSKYYLIISELQNTPWPRPATPHPAMPPCHEICSGKGLHNNPVKKRSCP